MFGGYGVIKFHNLVTFNITPPHFFKKVMRKVVFLFMFFAATLQGVAELRYHSELLQRMAKATALSLPDSLGVMTDNDSTWQYKGRQLRVRTNALGDVSHIGYKIFHNQIVALYENQALFDFLERYFLELDLHLDGKTTQQRMDVDRVVVKEGSVSMMTRVKETDPLSINYTPRRLYTVTWQVGGKPLTLSFPTDCQLMMGCNAIELENIFSRDVQRMPQCVDMGEALAPWAQVHEESSDQLKQKNYGSYLSHLIGSRIYLRMHDSQWQPDINPHSPVRSVCTLMLTGYSPQQLPLDLVIDRYGYRHEKLHVTLQQLLAYFRSEDSRVYIGIKEKTNNQLTGTLFVLNEKLGYNHVIPFTFPLSLLSGDISAPLTAKVYAYIPLQNVTEKFFEITDYKDPNYEN